MNPQFGLTAQIMNSSSAKVKQRKYVRLKPDIKESEAKKGGGESDSDSDSELKQKRSSKGKAPPGNIVNVGDGGKIPRMDGKLASYYNGNELFGPQWLASIYDYMADYYSNDFVHLCSLVAGNLGKTMDAMMDQSDQPSLIRQAAIESLVESADKSLSAALKANSRMKGVSDAAVQQIIVSENNKPGGEGGTEVKQKPLPEYFTKRELFLWLLERANVNQSHISLIEKVFAEEGNMSFRWLQFPEISRWLRLSDTMSSAISYAYEDLCNHNTRLLDFDWLLKYKKVQFAQVISNRIRVVSNTRWETDKGKDVIKLEYTKSKNILQRSLGIQPPEPEPLFEYPPNAFYTIDSHAGSEAPQMSLLSANEKPKKKIRVGS